MQTPLPVYLTVKEIWRNRARFALVIGVIVLLTILVLFTAGISEGLSGGSREFLQKVNADLLVYQGDVDVSIAASRIDQQTLRSIRRVDGVKAAGPIAFSTAAAIDPTTGELVNISMIGVTPGEPGEPPAFLGRNLGRSDANEAVIDSNLARRTGLGVGDKLTIKTTLGADEKFNDMLIVGITDGRRYVLSPSVTLPAKTWDKIRSKPASDDGTAEVIYNVAAVQLNNPSQWKTEAKRIEAQVNNVQAVDLKTAYQHTPGYQAQQSTLNTQQIFALVIGALVIGGFFHIQMIQRVAQIGMLKAIGASNPVVGLAFVLQIVLVTVLGVLLGTTLVLILARFIPPVIPITFTGLPIAAAIAGLLIIGPVGGLAALWSVLKIEPLTALRLN